MWIDFSLVFGTMLLLHLWMNGILWTWIRVKTSSGKNIMVKVRSITRDFYRVGIIKEGNLYYKNLNKEQKIIPIQDQTSVYRSMGLFMIDVDDEKNFIVNRKYEAVPGYDAVKYSHLLVRALTAPKLDDKKQNWIIILEVIILLVLIYVGYTGYSIEKRLDLLANVAPSGSSPARGQV